MGDYVIKTQLSSPEEIERWGEKTNKKEKRQDKGNHEGKDTYQFCSKRGAYAEIDEKKKEEHNIRVESRKDHVFHRARPQKTINRKNKFYCVQHYVAKVECTLPGSSEQA